MGCIVLRKNVAFKLFQFCTVFLFFGWISPGSKLFRLPNGAKTKLRSVRVIVNCYIVLIVFSFFFLYFLTILISG